MKRYLTVLGVVTLALALGDPPAHAQLPGGVKIPSTSGGPKLPGGGKLPGNPADCGGDLGSGAAALKIKAFLAATADVDKATASLEGSVRDACRDMAKALGISAEGGTKAVCNRVAAEIKASLRVGVKSKTAVVTRYEPAVCKVDADFTAQAAAKCEGKARADVKVSCSGRCSGTCNGACAGTCQSKNARGQCQGECQGTCRGSCSGDCSGSASVDGSAECKASASAEGNVKAKCTEPKLDVRIDSKTVVDASRIAKLEKALKVGLPALLSANAKAKLVASSVKAWAGTAKRLSGSGAALVKQLGAKSMCVAGDLAAAAKVATQVNVRVSVSVQASASVSGAAGAKAQ
jgi:hypothetical protein